MYNISFSIHTALQIQVLCESQHCLNVGNSFLFTLSDASYSWGLVKWTFSPHSWWGSFIALRKPSFPIIAKNYPCASEIAAVWWCPCSLSARTAETVSRFVILSKPPEMLSVHTVSSRGNAMAIIFLKKAKSWHALRFYCAICLLICLIS